MCLVDCLNFGLALNETPLTAREEEEEIELQKKELELLLWRFEIFLYWATNTSRPGSGNLVAKDSKIQIAFPVDKKFFS